MLRARPGALLLAPDGTLSELAAKHEIHPTLITRWKRQAVEGLAEVFAVGGRRDKDTAPDPHVAGLSRTTCPPACLIKRLPRATASSSTKRKVSSPVHGYWTFWARVWREGSPKDTGFSSVTNRSRTCVPRLFSTTQSTKRRF